MHILSVSQYEQCKRVIQKANAAIVGTGTSPMAVTTTTAATVTTVPAVTAGSHCRRVLAATVSAAAGLGKWRTRSMFSETRGAAWGLCGRAGCSRSNQV